MPIDYRFVPEHDLVVMTFAGKVTNEDLLEHGRRIVDDASIPEPHVELADLRSVEELEVSVEAISSLICLERSGPRSGTSKLAIVAPGDQAFGVSSLYKVQNAPHRPSIAVFRTLEEATEWLGVPLNGPG